MKKGAPINDGDLMMNMIVGTFTKVIVVLIFITAHFEINNTTINFIYMKNINNYNEINQLPEAYPRAFF